MQRETAAGSGAATTIDLSFLRKGHWFGALPPALQALILERAGIRSFRKGARVVSEGTPCRGLYVVVLGRVHVVRRLGDSPETLIHVAEAGFWFGEYALLSGAPAIASVVAASNAKVLLLPAAEFERIVAEEPRYYPHFTRLLTERFATVFRYASEARAVASEEWLRTRLNGLAERRQLDAPAEGPVEITVSQAELATMVGVSRQTLCMLLGRLQERGLVELGYRRIRVLARS
jgi:CRP-like cAMP-binding protein